MLRPLGEDLWVVDRDFRMGLVEFGGRMTVVRLSDGGLLLYSPVAIDDELAAQLEALGPVRHIVAPNAFHFLFCEAAAERFAGATTYGTAALARKRKELTFDVLLDPAAEMPAGFGDTLQMKVLAGAPKIDEVILHHLPSASLIVCDLVFNLREAKGLFSRLFFRVLGVFGRLAQSPLWRYIWVEDRAASEESLRGMWTWPITRIVPTHGHIIEGDDAKSQLAAALAWMCRSNAVQITSG